MTNDMAECTDGNVKTHKPIPIIEINIEKSIIESSEGGDVASITKNNNYNGYSNYRPPKRSRHNINQPVKVIKTKTDQKR